MNRRHTWALCAVLAAACEKPAPPPTHVLRITVLDRDELPMAGADVQLNKQSAGVTGADGVVTANKTGVEGTRVSGHVDCPEGFVSDAPDFVMTLSQIRGLSSREVAPLLQTVKCKPVRHEGVVLIKTAQPGISVVVDGTPSTQTDALGFAYVYLQKPNDGQVDIVLDTTTLPKLQPQSPSRRFQFKADDEIFEFDQMFVEEKPKPKKKKRVAAPKAPPPRHVPQRL